MRNFLIIFLCLFIQIQDGITQLNYLNKKNISVEITTTHSFVSGDVASLGDIEEISNQIGLFNLGGSYHGMLAGTDSIQSDFDLDQSFGNNGLQESTVRFRIQYEWGTQYNTLPQPWRASFSFSKGIYREGKGIKLEIGGQRRIIGGGMDGLVPVQADRFQWGIFGGIATGFDGSFNRTARQVGIYTSIEEKFVRESEQYDFDLDIAYQYSEDLSRGLEYVLPRKMGGSSFFVMGTAMAEGRYIVANWLEGNAQVSYSYDIYGQFLNKTGRTQNQLSASLGVKIFPWRLMSSQ